MRKYYILLILTLMFSQGNTEAQWLSINAEISADSLIHTLKELTGALPVTIDGTEEIITTRLKNTTGNRLASQYIANKLIGYGLDVEFQRFNGTNAEVGLSFKGISTIPGTDYPVWIYTDWGEVFKLEAPDLEWKSMKDSGMPLSDGISYLNVIDENSVIAMKRNGTYFKSNNGGVSWNEYSIDSPIIYQLFHSNAGRLIALGQRGEIFTNSGLDNSWTPAQVDDNLTLVQGAFTSENHVYLIGNNYNLPLNMGAILESHDSGLTWSTKQDSIASQLSAIFSLSSTHTWIAGNNGIVLRTIDAGAAWESINFAGESDTAKKIFFADINSGWILTTDNKIYRTIDGGETWNLISTLTNPETIEDIHFSDSMNGRLVGSASTLLETADGGITWHEGSLYLLNNVIATIEGTDNPDNYIVLTAHSDCYNREENRWVFAPGADDDGSGTVLVMELARVFAKFPPPVTIKFAFIPDEESSGDGADRLGEKLLGEPGICNLVMDFDMVGYDYHYPEMITLVTSDEAADLYTLYSNIIGTLNLSLQSNLWASGGTSNTSGFRYRGIPIIGFMEGGGYGSFGQPNYHDPTDTWDTINPEYIENVTKSAAALIIYAVNSQILDVDDCDIASIPTTFALHQNYPNPFNPTTKISFQLAESSFTTLKIYDSIGREVETLIADNLRAGAHEIIFDANSTASRLSSGVYFYKLQSGKLSETRKLLLIK